MRRSICTQYRSKLIAVIVAITLLSLSARAAADGLTDAEHEIQPALEDLYKARAEAFVNQDIQKLKDYYLDEKISRIALEHEHNQIQYLNKWSDKRAIQLTHSQCAIRIIRQRITGDRAVVSLVQSHRIGYMYENRFLPEQFFGVGTRHFITLKKKDGRWKVSREWYLDPLDENPKKISDGPDGLAPSVKAKSSEPPKSQKYNRKRAVEYANKYAGAAWGAGNRHRYNPKYLDYTSKGGDCTNFASQIIGDSEGGGLPARGNWRYFDRSGGTQTWVQTDSFSRFLIGSGYGKLLAKGTYEQITRPSDQYPDSAISSLEPGDLIGYILHNNDTDHFSVVVGFDDYGYPLVNSHTADRYRVPFDLGWDSETRYQLFHIRD
ncbi:amidase domain-containing protein [Paenibacillus spiritus]|uniref:Amidase domain-containing protein n=1 Tax=Paenibacillus spiritus TaxID=2496557 RepID=A0A5J5G940_9BACL|nr:amidase domain-containing protein [Paenibacillus spiritus]KAA9004189.1 amidase domain-containing protein [Paenibacillus spiritus]